MSETLLEATRGARELLSDPDRWHRGSMAADKEGKTVASSDPSAYRFCLLGALMRNTNSLSFMNPIRHLLPEWAADGDLHGNQRQLTTFNDDRRTRYQDVLRFLDAAIAYLEAGGEKHEQTNR